MGVSTRLERYLRGQWCCIKYGDAGELTLQILLAHGLDLEAVGQGCLEARGHFVGERRARVCQGPALDVGDIKALDLVYVEPVLLDRGASVVVGGGPLDLNCRSAGRDPGRRARNSWHCCCVASNLCRIGPVPCLIYGITGQLVGRHRGQAEDGCVYRRGLRSPIKSLPELSGCPIVD